MSADAERVSSTRVYGVALRDDEVLVVRASSRTTVPGLWWLPGGGIDFAEAPEAALVREIREETGLRASGLALLDVVNDVHERANGVRVHSIRLIYTVRDVEGELVPERNGTSDLAAWVPLRTLATMRVAPYALTAIALAQPK